MRPSWHQLLDDRGRAIEDGRLLRSVSKGGEVKWHVDVQSRDFH